MAFKEGDVVRCIYVAGSPFETGQVYRVKAARGYAADDRQFVDIHGVKQGGWNSSRFTVVELDLPMTPLFSLEEIELCRKLVEESM